MTKASRLIVIALLSAVSLAATTAFAATLTVCPSGCDYSSIGAALTAAGPGDTVQVAQGTYSESITLAGSADLTLQGGWDAAMTTRSLDPALTVINGDTNNDGAGEGCVIYLKTLAGESIAMTIEGLTMINGNAWANADSLNEQNGGGVAVYSAGSVDLTLRGVVIRDNLACGGGGLWAKADALGTVALTVENTMLVDNFATMPGAAFFKSLDGGASTVSLVNTTISGNQSDSTAAVKALTEGSASLIDITASNCIISGDTPAGANEIWLQNGLPDSSVTMTVSTSLVGSVRNSGSAFVDGGGNLTADDAVFVNPGKGDYRLNADSPCIDSGATIAGLTTDFEGVDRPQGAAYDVGASEHVATMPAAVRLLSPVGGEMLPSGGSVDITWESPPADRFKLSYSPDNGVSWIRIDQNVIIGGRHHRWTLPQTVSALPVKVKVVGFNGATKVGTGRSASAAIIEPGRILSPRGGKIVTASSAYLLSLAVDTSRTVQKVALYLSTDGGATWPTHIATLTSSFNLDPYTWTVPAVNKNRCRIKAVLKNAHNAKVGQVISDQFSIKP